MKALSQQQLKTWTPPLKSVIITDLDECSIDSDHRRSFNSVNGKLDFTSWRIGCTPEEIARDTLRPWGNRFAQLVLERNDCIFGTCTSREFIPADYDFLRDNLNLDDSTYIWHRETGCNEDTDVLKHRLLLENITADFNLLLAANTGNMYFFDDKVQNVLAAEQLGINGILVY